MADDELRTAHQRDTGTMITLDRRPTRPITVGLLLLIPALVALGPLGAALLIRRNNADLGTGTVAALIAIVAGLLAAAILAFATAWHHTRFNNLPGPRRYRR